MAQLVKDLSAMQETTCNARDACNAGYLDPIPESGRSHATENSNSILAWEIPWTEEPAWLSSMGSQESGTTW